MLASDKQTVRDLVCCQDSPSSVCATHAQTLKVANPRGELCCAGQFGTRLQGGKDAAGARYIMTRLDKIARVVFHEHDDKLLGYLKEEGQSIEPQWCALAPALCHVRFPPGPTGTHGSLLQDKPQVLPHASMAAWRPVGAFAASQSSPCQ